MNYRLLLTWMTVQPKLCGCQGCADDALVHLHCRTGCTVPAGCSSSSCGPGVSLGHCYRGAVLLFPSEHLVPLAIPILHPNFANVLKYVGELVAVQEDKHLDE